MMDGVLRFLVVLSSLSIVEVHRMLKYNDRVERVSRRLDDVSVHSS